MQHYLAIALGGALGSVLRFALNEAVSARFGRAFPWGTLSINVIGSFLIGLLAVLLIERWEVSPAVRLGLMVGVLGGFTTFSSFSLGGHEPPGERGVPAGTAVRACQRERLRGGRGRRDSPRPNKSWHGLRGAVPPAAGRRLRAMDLSEARP
jgi:protein CrcB